MFKSCFWVCLEPSSFPKLGVEAKLASPPLKRIKTGTTYQVLLELCIFHLCQMKIPFTEGTLGNIVLVLVVSQISLFGQSERQLYVPVVKQGISDILITGSLRYWIHNSVTKAFGFVLLKFR